MHGELTAPGIHSGANAKHTMRLVGMVCICLYKQLWHLSLSLSLSLSLYIYIYSLTITGSAVGKVV